MFHTRSLWRQWGGWIGREEKQDLAAPNNCSGLAKTLTGLDPPTQGGACTSMLLPRGHGSTKTGSYLIFPTTRSARSYEQHLPSIDGENRGSERRMCSTTLKSFWNNYLERKKLKIPCVRMAVVEKLGKIATACYWGYF